MLQYSRSGQLIAETYYDPKGNLVSSIRYSYDKKGRISLESCYSSGKLSYSTVYTYDGNGLLKEMATTGIEGISYKEFLYK